MILASVNYKHLNILVLFLFLFILSFVWKRASIASGVSTNIQKLICQEKENQNETAVKSPTPPKKHEEDIIVLIWKWPWGYQSPLDKCPEYGIFGCKLTVDRSLYGVADAVLIHHADIMYDKNSLPQEPKPNFQRWIWYNMEPPRIIQNLKMLDNLFNMTMTFRRDSDIHYPYGQMEPLKKRGQNFTIPKKSKLVSWVVSKWYSGAPRIAYYEELKNHITIDVYGAKHKKLSWDDFYATISQYKFYLAFENSVYKDYITEKLWSNAFGSWAVPVVLGTSRKNYERFVPGDAFIHVDDFTSPKELAAYLLELDKDDEKYRKFFNWRFQYRVAFSRGASYGYCKICAIIRESPVYQVLHSVEKWFLEDV
ncbi:3-galactosyl-N-acetylglucosaminide 4-alpha-L-fucosyltransferase FUT3-like [Bufo gargarizans]|uniref:3-galactosyl-N-acetylglucosaminide 4-alpha-L-fucosyltransferase FUT3-like n=1 Tax=Bufo gargarizans TaxID=30331 RepID=UPI001CF48AD2|nr:3-galactosyl-N-acetylglucosaminide 4-alpha-L-fucosyltransferase FUT3-like [Bufo gargarizans]